jgi:hypothetical protein
MLDHKTVQFSSFTKVGCHILFNRLYRVSLRMYCIVLYNARVAIASMCRFLWNIKIWQDRQNRQDILCSDIGRQVLLLFRSCPDRPEEAGAHVKRARKDPRTGLGGRCASLQSAKSKTMINTDMYFVYLYAHHWHPKTRQSI